MKKKDWWHQFTTGTWRREWIWRICTWRSDSSLIAVGYEIDVWFWFNQISSQVGGDHRRRPGRVQLFSFKTGGCFTCKDYLPFSGHTKRAPQQVMIRCARRAWRTSWLSWRRLWWVSLQWAWICRHWSGHSTFTALHTFRSRRHYWFQVSNNHQIGVSYGIFKLSLMIHWVIDNSSDNWWYPWEKHLNQ